MKVIISLLIVLMLTSCAHTNELSAPCTYYDRKGCGEQI
jgi:hypothetical protein